MNKLMLSCKNATELMEKKNFVGLTTVEKIQLFVHTRLCDTCTRYGIQNKFIEQALHRHSTPEQQASSVQPKILPGDAKAKIIERIENK